MIQIGEYQTMELSREMAQGFYLIDPEVSQEVLLPRKYVPEGAKVGDQIDVLVYKDNEGRPIATTEDALLEVDEYAFLEVKQVNKLGAFCDWGVTKQLLVPFRNQHIPMQEGKSYVVHMYLDEKTQRLVGSTKLDGFLESFSDEDIQSGQKVDILVYKETDIGFKVVVDQYYAGLIYKSELRNEINIGDELPAFVKPIRDDGKIDISLDPIGHQNIEPNAQLILDALKDSGGELPLSDKSDPDAIRARFGISKKLFKKAIGNLYKAGKLKIEPQRIILLSDDKS